MLGLPDGIRACLFDLDGVLTDTASVHAAAWKQMFDEFLAARAKREARSSCRSTSRPTTSPTSTAGRDSTAPASSSGHGGSSCPKAARTTRRTPRRSTRSRARKNDLVQEKILTDGVTVYPGSMRYVHAARDAGLKTAVVSSSANAAQVLDVAGYTPLIDHRVDGVTAKERGIAGKPAPDTFLAAADDLGVAPSAAAVFEDALAGVAAGHAGGFGAVVGVDRVGHADALRTHGADVVVTDLADLLGSDRQDGAAQEGGAR